MADIVVKCAQCGKETSVSEYVDPDLATCGSCGEKLDIPHVELTGPRPPPQKEKPKDGPSPLERNTMTAFRVASARRARVHKRKRIISWSPSVLTTWLIFGIGAIVVCLLRFVLLKDSELELLIKGGLACLLILHFTVIVDAFADSIMTGLLCLFVPFYSFFYLYTMCDSYVLRLAVGILLLPFGCDGAVRVYKLIDLLLAMLRKSAMFEG